MSDLSFDTPPALNKAVTVDRAWQLLHRDETTVALPVVEDDGTLFGMLSTNTIAAHDMRSVLHPEIEDIPVFNLVSALEGSIVLDAETPTNSVSGRVTIALPTGGEEAIQLTPETMLICGHQPEVILDALEAGVACVVVCQASVPEEIRQ